MEAPTGRGGGGKGEEGRRQSYLRLESTLARTTEALPAFGDKDSRIWRALPRLREPSPPMAVASAAQHQKFAATSLPSLLLPFRFVLSPSPPLTVRFNPQ